MFAASGVVRTFFARSLQALIDGYRALVFIRHRARSHELARSLLVFSEFQEFFAGFDERAVGLFSLLLPPLLLFDPFMSVF